MKFNCKNCGTLLTKELTPGEFVEVKKPITVEFEGGQEEFEETENVLPEGTVEISDSSVDITWIDGLALPEAVEIPSIAINKNDFLGTIPKYESGMGCCDLDGDFVRCHGNMKFRWQGEDVPCRTIVGMAFLDCWQTKRVELFTHTIEEVE